jgi:DNA-binding IscR family transcriptional regulator
MPGYIDSAVRDIDDRLRELKDEAARLEAARAALTGAKRRPARPAGNDTARTRGRSSNRRNGRSATRRGGNTRANQALEIVRERPGITIPELASTMKIQPNYLYRVLPGLASLGEVRREGQGWHPGESSSPAPATSAPRRATPRRRTRATKPSAKAPAATRKSRRSGQANTASRARTAPGATRTSVLAAFRDGEVLTAGQIAEKTGLGRNTVATTLSRLAKSGELQKARRGYRRAAGNGRNAPAPAVAAATE